MCVEQPAQEHENIFEIDLWPLDVKTIESRCSERDLWESSCPLPFNDKDADKVVYWQHEMAAISSNCDQVAVIIGILVFVDGTWRLQDSSGSTVQCLLVGDHLNVTELYGRLVFATKFVVHRETFQTADTSQPVKIQTYVSLSVPDELHVASAEISPLPLKSDDLIRSELVQFLLLNKSLPQMIHFVSPQKGRVFGYLISVSLLQSAAVQSDAADLKRRRKTNTPISCMFFCGGEALTCLYPCLVEGNVYQVNKSKDVIFQALYEIFF